jgi:DNA polymerase
MLRLDSAQYNIALHVHDEVVMEMPDDKGSLDEALKIMRSPIPWAKGLPLDADGFETQYYKK